jgi:hypothetical protein
MKNPRSKLGDLVERSITSALKAEAVQTAVGSNPTIPCQHGTANDQL